MNAKGRKLFRCAAGFAAVTAIMSAAYATTAMASGIGQIDAAKLLDIHAEADSSSEVVGQVMDEGHVAILEQNDGWVRIQAGEIIGWVPGDNLIEKDISNEEAVEANEEVIEQLAEEAQNTEEQTQEEQTEEQAQEEQTEETQKAQAGCRRKTWKRRMRFCRSSSGSGRQPKRRPARQRLPVRNRRPGKRRLCSRRWRQRQLRKRRNRRSWRLPA